MRIDLYILGRLALGEILCLLVLLLYPGKVQKVLKHRDIRIFFILLGMWFLSIILSDIYNETEFSLFLRGAARPPVIGVMFIGFLVLLWDHPRSITFFLMGLVLAAMQNVVLPTDFRAVGLDDTNAYAYFAFVYTPLLLAGSALLAWFLYPINRNFSGFILLSAGALSSVNFSRTTAAALFISGLLILFGRTLGLKLNIRRKKSFNIQNVAIFLLALTLLYGLLSIYISLSLEGYFGERIMFKMQTQAIGPSQYPILNMLLTGRHYNISNYLMIVENPFFGTGSWPLTGRYDYRALQFIDYQISSNFLNSMDTQRGTGHSILFGNWANYGPFAVPFWAYIFLSSIKLLRITFTLERRIFVALSIFLVIFIFSILFNNLNSLSRAFSGIVPALLIVLSARFKT
ncbi:hypothetical protein N9876_00800 [bacterium]|nr:hypothetical protein [bacterium]